MGTQILDRPIVAHCAWRGNELVGQTVPADIRLKSPLKLDPPRSEFEALGELRGHQRDGKQRQRDHAQQRPGDLSAPVDRAQQLSHRHGRRVGQHRTNRLVDVAHAPQCELRWGRNTAQPADQPLRSQVVQGRQRDLAVLDHLDQRPAGPHHHDGAELTVVNKA